MPEGTRVATKEEDETAKLKLMAFYVAARKPVKVKIAEWRLPELLLSRRHGEFDFFPTRFAQNGCGRKSDRKFTRFVSKLVSCLEAWA